jgi:hypothetical protein
MTRRRVDQHEAHTAQMAALTRAAIVVLDNGGALQFHGRPSTDGPTPIYDEMRDAAEALAYAQLPHYGAPGAEYDAHPLAAWLPILGWLFFAGLLVWAVWS